ncbi:lytic transglycosylase domain-containing protein [Xenorhabdus ishibashii]|uniref:Putative transglycosylase n=1 Tax=Xenorhabdus ishibashii TaxID=1034471 RepID=A0A2D0K8L0_9GAMM|nr:lytic transglycosylase domain-containing protein [Xenorhabdus ishibashii]PHM59547.1 putative transglycosylase [Xenorhabdus ishibashii]
MPNQIFKKIVFTFILSFSSTVLADCFEDAGRYYGIDPDYIRAIAWQESRFKHNAINNNVDFGIMQINTKTLRSIKREYPTLTKKRLINEPCLNIFVGSMLLKRNFDMYGKKWLSVGMYNAGMKNEDYVIKNRYDYALLISKHYQDLKSGKIKRVVVN